MADNKRLMIKPEGNTTAENEQKIYQDYLSTMAAKSAAIDNATTTPSIATTLYKAEDTFGVTDNGTTVSVVAPNGETVTFAKNIGTTTVPEPPATTTTDNDAAAYQSALNEVLASYQAAENERARALQENYNNAVKQAQNSFNSGKDSLRQSTDEALRQAYISYMLGQRGLNQQLSNGGINGGALESILANLHNNYGGNRTSIENAYNSNLAGLVSDYNNQIANLGMNYNTNYADVLADYNNQVANTQNSYASTLANLLSKKQADATDTTGTTHTIDRKTAVSTLAKYVNSPASALAYVNALGDYTDEEKEMMLWEAGIDPSSLVSSSGSNVSGSGNVAGNVSSGTTGAKVGGTTSATSTINDPVKQMLTKKLIKSMGISGAIK